MYQFVSAIVKPLSGNGRWTDLDIGNLPLNQIFSQFRKVIVTLSNNFLDHNVSFNIEMIRPTFGASPLTFNEFLVQNGSATLPTFDTIPVINTRFARYADGFHAGYSIEPMNPNYSFTANIPAGEKTWLRLTKEGIDYRHFYESCLVSVNGFYHKTDYSADGAFVVNGMTTARRANRNELGILNFESLGKLSFIPITTDMIYKQSTLQSLSANCYIDTNVDLSNKAVMLVLGGYLHVLDKTTFFRVSPSAFSIDFSNLPLIERYYESYEILDLSSLQLQLTKSNDSQISVEDIFSDDVLKRYLTLENSFFVVLDNPDIFTEEQYLRTSPYPGVYTSFTKPIYPAIVGAGRHEAYWYRVEDGQYSIHMNDTMRKRRVYTTASGQDLEGVSDGKVIALPERNAIASFLLIGTDI